MDDAYAREWLDSFGQAWRDRNPQRAAELFTVDAIYRSDPFRPPLIGRTAIADYWARATESQSSIQVRFGEPVVQGERVAVEWWSMVDDEGQPTTDCGGLFLTFENGRCTELREYWNLTEQAVAAPEGWGQ
jgi:predicted SnoaL-like aldol condensation-catalyzing enzyme